MIQATGLIVSAVLAILAIGVVRKSRKLPRNDGRLERKTERRFYLMTAAEAATLFGSFLLLMTIHRSILVASVSELIVGLHFVVLARVLDTRAYYTTGAALGGAGGLGICTVLAMVRSGSSLHWSLAVLSFVSALILLSTGFIGAFQAQHSMNRRIGGRQKSPGAN